METEVEVEGNDEGKFEASVAGEIACSFSSFKQIASPVVYKLVRVEGDGRFVPATDDEVMEVESLLADNKSEIHIVADTGQTLECISKEGSSSALPQLESSEGLSQIENAQVFPDKSDARFEENVPSLPSSLSESHGNHSGNVGESSNPPDKVMGDGTSTSGDLTTSIPDFSKLKGEICLDNLSIKELHETFKATFGRETTVKDKQWLKRRISMGLTNSCDVSTTTFVIRDNKLITKDSRDISKNLDDTINGELRDSPISHQSLLEGHHAVSDKRNHSIGDISGGEDHDRELRAAKRVRKPTKRYIEELSEVESKELGGKLRASVNNSGFGQIIAKPHVRAVKSVSIDGRTIITRLDSLGGSGVEIPCVSRIRRSRPRKNFMALLKFDQSGMGKAATLVKKAIVTGDLQSDVECENKVIQTRSAPEQAHCQLRRVVEKENQLLASDAIGLTHDMDMKRVDSSENLDDNVATVPTSKGGIRRKHHRAWTVSEVVKLVEGVSRYGAGRWSEIKRLAFSSYSYRTSVDLKDKWRNLLKASLAQTPADKGMNQRKNAASIPIPAPILSRVRELAEMQTQATPNLTSSSKGVGSAEKSVHETQSGFL